MKKNLEKVYKERKSRLGCFKGQLYNFSRQQLNRCYDTLHNDTLHNNISIKRDTQHNGRALLCWVSFLLSVTFQPFLLSVIMLSVVTPSVVAPLVDYGKVECLSLQKLVILLIFVTCKQVLSPFLDWSPTRAGSNPACKFKTKLIMTDRDKRSSLPWYQINYNCKKLYRTGPAE